MATMNNWLAFSLSPQDQLPPSQTNSTLISAAATTTTAGDSSTGDVCFNIPQGN
jgi:AP2-like factor (ANT lineage)